jgi:signal transduction histidine kinase
MVLRTQRRLIALFFAAVLLPCALLVLLTVRGMRQERELAGKRVQEEAARIMVQVRQALRTRLEGIASRELNAHTVRTAVARNRSTTDSSVRLVADIAGGRAVPPWDATGGTGRASTWSAGDFGHTVRDAESEEFGRGNLEQAAALYREAVTAARRGEQAGYARLALARVLTRLGRTHEAAAQYALVFALDFDATDAHRVPLALYAATRLADRTPASVLNRLSGEVARRCCLAPEALYMLRHVVDTLAPRTSRARSRDGDPYASLRRLVDERIRTAEHTVALLAELPELGLRPIRRTDAPTAAPPGLPRWIVHGREPWFVGVTATAGGTASVLVAVDVERVLAAINRTLPSDLGVNGTIRLALPGDAPDRLLGPDFASLGLDLQPAGGPIADGGIARLSYLGILIVVLGVTLFGAYLIWFDVRRELRMADLRSQFVASVSHELKTPLTAIRMFGESLALDRFQNPATRREYIDTIVNETERLTRLLDNVLDLSKIERGQKQYRLKPTALSDVIERCAHMLQYPLAQRGFCLTVTVAEAVPPVTADEDALEQAVLNLLTNAMKYSGDSRDIDLRLRRVNGEAIIDVQDRGVGIPAALTSRVIEKFYRVPSADNAGIPGTGLGLTLVEHIVAAHGGHLAIESAPGRGSTFSIHLPLEPSQ